MPPAVKPRTIPTRHRDRRGPSSRARKGRAEAPISTVYLMWKLIRAALRPTNPSRARTERPCRDWIAEAAVLSGLLAWSTAPRGTAAGDPWRIRECLRSDLLNRVDYERMERGYYEQILDAGQSLGAPLPTSLAGRKGGPNLVCEAVADLREVVLEPSLRVIQPVGASWSTNARGMRDRAYTRAKPPATFRIALAGDSIGAGWGVGDGAGFEPRLERSLAEQSRAAGGPAVEILNFSVPGRSPGQRWYHFNGLAWTTEPDLVIYEATQADVGWDRRQLARLLARGIGWDSRFYARVLKAAGVRPGESAAHYAQALQPYDWELTAEVYRHVAADCRAHSVPSVWLLLPRVGRPVEPADHQRLVSLAREAGFTSLVDLSDSFDGLDPSTLTARSDDYHPNSRGHALLAGRLHQALREDPSTRLLWEGPRLPPLAFEDPSAP